MTFSIAARCPDTGAFGIAITTASLCVGARCPFVMGGVGAVLTQNRTDPRLGPRGLELLKAGASAREAIDELVRTGHVIGWRQLAVVDNQGRVAHYNGHSIVSKHGGYEGDQCVSIGNLLVSDTLPKAMVDGFNARKDVSFTDRLIDSLEAGLAAGGEINPVRSVAVLVANEFEFAHINLRIDNADEPIAKMRDLWRAHEPEVDNYLLRVTDPDAAI